MVQDFVDAAYSWTLGVADLARHLAWVLLAAAVAAGALWLAFRRLDPEDRAIWQPKLQQSLRITWRTFALLMLVTVICGVLVQARKMVTERRTTLEEASASRKKAPQLSGIVQYAPSVAILQLRTYTRRLTMPPMFLNRLGEEGVQVLAPYLTDPSAEDVLKLVDTFKRSGPDVVFTREVTRRDEFPVAADSADVQQNFESQATPGGRIHYQVAFDGTYRFHNPNSEPATMRFNFPLPQGGGTIQGFYIQVGDARVTEPDEHGMYVWQGTIPPGQTVTAAAHYNVTGGGDYVYTLGSERRRIGDFHMVARSNREMKFGRSGIFPTALVGNGAEWRLKDVLTSQNIDLTIPRTNIGAELFDKTLSLLPVVLVLFAAALWWFAPARALPGALAVGFALALIPVVSGYVSPLAATLLGAIAVLLVGIVALPDRREWPLVAGAALLTCVFVIPNQGTLIAFAVVVVVVAVLARLKPRPERMIPGPSV